MAVTITVIQQCNLYCYTFYYTNVQLFLSGRSKYFDGNQHAFICVMLFLYYVSLAAFITWHDLNDILCAPQGRYNVVHVCTYSCVY